MGTQAGAGQVAPGSLEDVRVLLNTWHIPNDTRDERDDLGSWLAANRVPAPQAASVRLFRDELRRAVEDAGLLEASANAWISRFRISPTVAGSALRLTSDDGVAARLATAVVASIGEGTFARLKACPDCRWVFYDNTRNGSKKWCVMNGSGPESRGCGNIAKARRHRERAATGREALGASSRSRA